MRNTKLNKLLSVLVTINLVLGLVPKEAWAYEAEVLETALAGMAETPADETAEELAEAIGFDRACVAGDVTIALRARDAVLPPDATLVVEEVGGARREAIAAAVAAVRGDEEAAISHAFELSLEGKDGTVAFEAGHELEVGFVLPEEQTEGLEPRVYRIAAGPDGDPVAEPLEVTEDRDADVAVVRTDDPSRLVVEFVSAASSEEGSDGEKSGPEGEGEVSSAQSEEPMPVAGETTLPAHDDDALAAYAAEEESGPVGDDAVDDASIPVGDDACATAEAIGSDDAFAETTGADDASVDAVEADDASTGTAEDDDAPAGASLTTEITASSATDNIVGEVFANAVNESLETGESLADSIGEEKLAEYPTERHERTYYASSERLRPVTSAEGLDMGYLVYRDSLFVLSQEDAADFEVQYSADGRTAYVEPALDPAQLEGMTGIVLLRKSVDSDVVLIFAEATTPALDGDTLVAPLAATDYLTLNQIFSDGHIGRSASFEMAPGAVSLGSTLGLTSTPGVTLARPQASTANQGAAGLRRALAAPAQLTNASGGSGAEYSPTFHLNPSGTNWKASIEYNTISFDRVKGDYDFDVWDLKFDLVLSFALGFDFDVTSTGKSDGRERVEVIGLGVSLDLFTLNYAAIFEAEFDETPVHIEGRMSPSMDLHWNPLFGVSIRNFEMPVDLKALRLTNPERDKNKDVRFYLGSGFTINQGFLSAKIKVLDITIGPICSLNQLSQGGTHYTVRFEKDTYDPASFDRTQDSLHTCAATGRKGCYAIHTKETSDWSWDAKLDLYFKSWPYTLKNEHHDKGEKDFYNSLAMDSGLREGMCPGHLRRVPVTVLSRDGSREVPVPDMLVDPVMPAELQGVSDDEYATYTQATTDAAGHAVLYLPAAATSPYTLVASGTYLGSPVVGSAKTGQNLGDEVRIYLDSADRTLVQAQVVWDADVDGNDRPASVFFAVEMRSGKADNWQVVGLGQMNANAELMGRLSDGGGEPMPWTWSHWYPTYSLSDGAYELNEFRVVQLDAFDIKGSQLLSVLSRNDMSAAYMDLGRGTWSRLNADGSIVNSNSQPNG